jgi:flagellar biosynthetic protein FliR
MVNFSDAQLQAWLAALLWPLARILGMMMTAPFFSEAGIPVTVKVLLGVLITLAIAPTLGPLPAVAVGSWDGIAILVREILIGTALGMLLQVLFAAVTVAGELAGTQMGLGFSTLYDPTSESSTTSLTAVLTTLAALVFFAIDGHLMLFGTLAQTFQTLPIASAGLRGAGVHQLAAYGGVLCLHAVVMALPVTMTLIIVNVALGMLSRAAPQLNIFSIGFPITLGAGVMMLSLGMPEWLRAFDQLWGVALGAVARTATAL